MADSLRDQLIAAGYEAPKKPEKKKTGNPGSKRRGKGSASNPQNRSSSAKPKRPHDSNRSQNPSANASGNGGQSASQKAKRNRKGASSQTDDPGAIEQRKQLKARIKALIDEHKFSEWKGEVVYRYLVEKRIRELYVTEDVQKKLAERELAVTRLNGDTYLVPRQIALDIKEINPQWSVFNLDNSEPDVEQSEQPGDDYADFQVPDDLKW